MIVNRPTKSRRKMLNLIYFVDSAKTRTVQIPLSVAVFVAVIAASLVTWTAVSAYLAVATVNEYRHLVAIIQKSKNTILDYEIRYENIYESAYPEPSAVEGVATASTSIDAVKPTGNTVQSAKPLASNKPLVPPPSSAKNLATQAKTVSSEPPVEDEVIAQDDEESPLSQPLPAGGNPVIVERPQFKGTSDALELRVEIRNTDQGRKAEGWIWAIAKYTAQDGQGAFVASPKEIRLDSRGEVVDYRGGQRYSIQFRKPKSFVFQRPSDQPGNFTDVRIILSDSSGLKQEYAFPVVSDQNL